MQSDSEAAPCSSAAQLKADEGYNTHRVMHIPLSFVPAPGFIVYSKMTPLTSASVSKARGCRRSLVGLSLALVIVQRQQLVQTVLPRGLLNRVLSGS